MISGGPAASGRTRSGPLEAQLDRLLNRLAGIQREWMREIQWPNVRLVRRVGPVALVLHLEGVAQHGAGHLEPWRDLVGECADVHDGLLGVDHLRKEGLDHFAAHIGHQRRMPTDPLQCVQHDEAGPVRDKGSLRSPASFEAQRAVRTAGDARSIDEALTLLGADRAVGDDEAIARLLHGETVDFRVVRAPVLVPHDVGNGTNGFTPAVPDVAQVAGVQLGGQRARPELPGVGRRLLGAEQHDRARWGFGHGWSPRPVRPMRHAGPACTRDCSYLRRNDETDPHSTGRTGSRQSPQPRPTSATERRNHHGHPTHGNWILQRAGRPLHRPRQRNGQRPPTTHSRPRAIPRASLEHQDVASRLRTRRPKTSSPASRLPVSGYEMIVVPHVRNPRRAIPRVHFNLDFD